MTRRAGNGGIMSSLSSNARAMRCATRKELRDPAHTLPIGAREMVCHICRTDPARGAKYA